MSVATQTLIDVQQLSKQYDLKTEVRKLAEQNNRSGKHSSLFEMDHRFTMLSKALHRLLEAQVVEHGERPQRMKSTHKVVYSKEFPKRKGSNLEVNANVSDKHLAKAPLHTIEGMTNLLDYNAEQLARKQEEYVIQTRSRREWQRLERQHVERSDYTLPDLYDDFKTLMEVPGSILTWKDYQEERKLWRGCKCRFCLNMFPMDRNNFKSFPHRRKDSRYCSEKCRQREKDARKEFEFTREIYDNGTFLPPSAYKSKTDKWRQDTIKSSEFSKENMQNYDKDGGQNHVISERGGTRAGWVSPI